MKRHEVISPNQWLEQDDTALVRVVALIPQVPSVETQLTFVYRPKESRVSDLHHGWLLDTRLREQRMLQNVVRQKRRHGHRPGIHSHPSRPRAQ